MTCRTPGLAVRAIAAVGLAGGLLASGLALAPSAAYAESFTVDDAVGDTVTSGDGQVLTPAPRAKSLDVVRTTFDYRERVLVVKVVARAAKRSAAQEVRIRARGKNYTYVGNTGGRVFPGDRGAAEECPGASTRADREAGTYTFRVPARCFGAPGRVRVGFALYRVGDLSPGSLTLDDALEGPAARRFTTLDLGPFISRG